MTEAPPKATPGTDLPRLAPERPGTGCCCQAQADGVPCPDETMDCPTCGRAQAGKLPDDLDGKMMSDGLYPYVE